MNQNINDFIGQISAIRDKEIVIAYIPSLQKTCKFNPLNMKQQKELLKSAGEGAVGALSFNKALLEIIVENLIDEVELNSIDRYSVLLALRSTCLGSEITVDGKAYNINNLPKPEQIEMCELSGSVTYKNIKVNLQCPSLTKDLNFFNTNIFDLKKIKNDNIAESVAAMYVLELIKFITHIELKETSINFDDLSINDKKQIIDNLPVALIQNILKFITNIRETESQFVTFDDNTKVEFNTLFFSVE